MENGMLHLYLGDGKGKTTAALGLLFRAYGAGLSCLFVQFLKGTPTAELKTLDRLGIPYLRTEDVKKFVPFMSPEELDVCKKDHCACFSALLERVRCGSYDCIVLDEVLDAVGLGMIDEAKLVSFLLERKGKSEVILTGRDPGEQLLSLADYVTEMKKKKHPYERGITARHGIEY